MSDVHSLPVRAGDLVVVGTDGLFDNLFAMDILHALAGNKEVLPEEKRRGKHVLSVPIRTDAGNQLWDVKTGRPRVRELAQTVAQHAHGIARDYDKPRTPFATEARLAGFHWDGGKLDDITVLVAEVVDPSAAAADTTRSKL